MTRIERRQTRVRRIREQYKKAGTAQEEVPNKPEVHHVIGKSQNHPENIPRFLQKYAGDPAIKVSLPSPKEIRIVLNHFQDFIPKLKAHLLPRIKATLVLSEEESVCSTSRPFTQALPDSSFPRQEPSENARDTVFFKNDCIYRHHLVRFNYTTYDVRRSQDVVNPQTSHSDVMLLADPTGDDVEENAIPVHPFLYARVLGIFHANVVYAGPGVLDYTPRRLEFLWVRWFQYSESHPVSWKDCRLDCVKFPPIASNDSFGFVDPRDVLRGCHIMQRFARGKVHADGKGLSRCAADSNDWRYYYIGRCDCHIMITSDSYIFLRNRFVDRDMTMRYHWGLAVGHIYTHGQTASKITNTDKSASTTHSGVGLGLGAMPIASGSGATPDSDSLQEDGADVEQVEADEDDEDYIDLTDGSEAEGADDFSDDDMVLAMEDMYGARSND